MADNRREAARKIARFREIIASRVNGECDEVMQDIAKHRETELAEFRASLEQSETVSLAERKQKISVTCTKALSDKHMELRRKYNARREALRESVFDAVRLRLKDFVGTPEYKAWFNKKLEQYSGWEISYPEGGGFIASAEGKLADESLEHLLAEQREWFLSVFEVEGTEE